MTPCESFQVSKEYFISSDTVYINENFKVDYKIIALLDITEFQSAHGNTIVLHEKLGIFYDVRTTKQIVNEFDKVNGLGFAVSDALMKFFEMKHYKPFVFGNNIYVPMTGATRKNSDWIGMHYVERFKQEKGLVIFTLKNSLQIKLAFPHGDFDARMHDVAVLSFASIQLFKAFAEAGRIKFDLGDKIEYFAQRYDRCPCPRHQQAVMFLNNLWRVIDWIMVYLLIKIKVESINPDEQIKYYLQNLKRIKKLY